MTPDAFVHVTHALRARWLEEGASWPCGPREHDRTRNLLLDACGSDHRALVELVLAVGDDLRPALEHIRVTLTVTLDRPRWETQRAPLVHRLVATRFLQTDIARWLVDSWAFAVGMITHEPASPALQTVDDESPAVATSTHTSALAPRGVRGLSTWRRAAAAPSSGTGAVGTGIAAPTRPATTRSASALMPPAPVGRSRMSPAELARIKRMERTGMILLASAGVFAFVAHGYAMWSRPLERESTAVTGRAISPMAPPATTNGLADAETTIPTQTGPAGRYRVSHLATSVTGGDGCDLVAGALAQQQTSIEVVEYNPGTATIRLASRQVGGAVQPDGQFQIGPDSGTTDGVRWTFVMRGQFTRDGFIAQSQKTTDAIVKWHAMRSCAVVADLVGTRLRP